MFGGVQLRALLPTKFSINPHQHHTVMHHHHITCFSIHQPISCIHPSSSHHHAPPSYYTFFSIHQVISSIHPSFHQISCDYHLISSLMCLPPPGIPSFRNPSEPACSLPASVPAQHSKRRSSGMVPTSP